MTKPTERTAGQPQNSIEDEAAERWAEILATGETISGEDAKPWIISRMTDNTKAISRPRPTQSAKPRTSPPE